MGDIEVRLPYVRQVGGRLFWEPSRRIRQLGFAAEPLGADLEKAVARARQLNEQVAVVLASEAKTKAEPAKNTLAWVILDYRRSKRWERLAPSTRRGYGQCLDRIERKFGRFRPQAITRRVVKEWQETMEGHAPAFAAAILRVLCIVMLFAMDKGHRINLDDYRRLDLHTAGGNSEPWEDYEISAYLDEARRQSRQSMALALMLGVCLGQREGDIITLPRSAYDPRQGTVTLRQHKTGKALALPVLPELRRELELMPKLGTIFVISEKSRKAYSESHFRHIHRDICRAAGIPDARKFMHLRHTAATRLGDAGCSDDLIRAVTGHADRSVVARYVKPTETMAKAAIAKLIEHRRSSKGEP